MFLEQVRPELGIETLIKDYRRQCLWEGKAAHIPMEPVVQRTHASKLP